MNFVVPPRDGTIIDLAEFPHIHARVSATWGSHECRRYLHNLIYGTDDSRMVRTQFSSAGFPQAYANKLLHFLDLHDTLYPQHCVSDSNSRWGFLHA